MANAFTATNQIASAKRRGWIPSSTALLDADILALFNEEQRVYLTALLKSARDEYLVNETDYDAAYVAGQSQVRVPTRCVGAALRQVWALDGSGNASPLSRVEPEKRHLYNGSGDIAGFMLRGNVLQLLPTPGGAGTIRIAYLQRLSTIVDETACGLVTAINTGTKAVTVSALPADGSFGANAVYDFVQGVPPFDALGIDRTLTLLAGNTLTFASALPAGLAVGDYIALAGTTPIPQVPQECQSLLAQRVVVKVLEATGSPRYDAAKASLEEMRADVMALMAVRVTGAPRPIVNANGPGMRRST